MVTLLLCWVGRLTANRTGDVKRTFGRCGRVLTEQIDPTDEPWAEFTFNYRSWEALEEEGILPKSAPPATTFDFLN